MKFLSILANFLLLISVFSNKHVVEQIEIYKALLGGSDTLTLDGFRTLIGLHDDWVCNDSCEVYMKTYLGVNGLPWDTIIDGIVEKLYGDNISYDPYQPQEVHLALTGSEYEMKVMWVTGSNLEAPYVEYTLVTDDNWENSVIANATNFTYSVPQYWWPVFEGVIYEANMVELVGSSRYKYRVMGYDCENNTIRSSDIFEFNAARSLSEPDQKVVISVLGDQGTFMLFGFATTDLLVSMQDSYGVDLVMYAGDLCYAGLSSNLPPMNITKDDEFEHVWDLWGIQNEPISATRPFMVGVGNHEKFYNYTAFNNRYHMPYSSSEGNENFWYSYNYGSVHWISISSEHSLEPDSPQMQFLLKDLEKAQANRSLIPWIVLSLHRPIYCSSMNSFSDTRPGSKYQAALEPLLLQYDVDLTVTGHMHMYERIHPNVDGHVTDYPTKQVIDDTEVDVYHSDGLGPVHVVQGNTGAMQDSLWVYPVPPWSAVRYANGFVPGDERPTRDNLDGLILDSNYTDTFGIGLITFMNSTHLFYDSVPITGNITDKFWIVKRLP